MTGAELKTLRESMGLTTTWIANNTPHRREKAGGVSRRIVELWESGDVPVPADVSELISGVRDNWHGWIEKAIQGAIKTIERAQKDIGQFPERIDLYRYKSDGDLWAAHPGFRGMPATYHAAGLARVKEAVEREFDLDVTIHYAER